jgi:hypothetical protein
MPVVGLGHEVHYCVVWVYIEARPRLRAVVMYFFLNCGVWRPFQIFLFGMYRAASTILLETLDWKLSRISMFEVEAVPHSCIT